MIFLLVLQQYTAHIFVRNILLMFSVYRFASFLARSGFEENDNFRQSLCTNFFKVFKDDSLS